MPKLSAGILLYRQIAGETAVLLVHPGGPFWAKKDDGAWSVPKGEYTADEDPFAAAKREFAEELGSPPPEGEYHSLREVKYSNKQLQVWTTVGDFAPEKLRSNTFELEWPPKSGRTQTFAEVDKAEWFVLSKARHKLVRGQVPLLDQLAELLGLVVGADEDDKPAADSQLSLL